MQDNTVKTLLSAIKNDTPEDTKYFIQQIAYLTNNHGSKSIIDLLNKKFLTKTDILDKIKNIESDIRVITAHGKVKMFKGEMDGIIIFILRHKYGVSHTELSKIYNKSIPSISIKYNKIAKMKRDDSNKKILIFDIIDNFVNK